MIQAIFSSFFNCSSVAIYWSCICLTEELLIVFFEWDIMMYSLSPHEFATLINDKNVQKVVRTLKLCGRYEIKCVDEI